MTRLYLVRHGETAWNSEIRIQGQRDVPLSDHGRRQAQGLAERLAGVAFAAAYSSDLQRAAETAAIILRQRGLEAERLPALREASFGVWEGLTYTEVTARYPEEQAQRRGRPAEVAPTGGESLPELLGRVRGALDSIAQAHWAESVLVVTHGGPLRVALGALLGLGLDSYWKLRVDNCSLSIVDTYAEGAIISLLNDTCHLPLEATGGDVP